VGSLWVRVALDRVRGVCGVPVGQGGPGEQGEGCLWGPLGSGWPRAGLRGVCGVPVGQGEGCLWGSCGSGWPWGAG